MPPGGIGARGVCRSGEVIWPAGRRRRCRSTRVWREPDGHCRSVHSTGRSGVDNLADVTSARRFRRPERSQPRSDAHSNSSRSATCRASQVVPNQDTRPAAPSMPVAMRRSPRCRWCWSTCQASQQRGWNTCRYAEATWLRSPRPTTSPCSAGAAPADSYMNWPRGSAPRCLRSW